MQDMQYRQDKSKINSCKSKSNNRFCKILQEQEQDHFKFLHAHARTKP